MSVAIESSEASTVKKEEYDAEFDTAESVSASDDVAQAADDDWCLVTCGIITCTITG